RNEFHTTSASRTYAFLRKLGSVEGTIDDAGLLRAHTVIHVSAETADPVDSFCREFARDARARTLGGVVRPMVYTGNAMCTFAYANRVLQQSGSAMPNAFLVPMSKTPAWWQKDWMERHTYFLPRYDNDGRMLNEGHALASAAGIECLMRRTYKHHDEV